MPVHWGGRVCKMDEIKLIAKKYKIPIIEDACHAILAKYKNKLAGNFGDFGCVTNTSQYFQRNRTFRPRNNHPLLS